MVEIVTTLALLLASQVPAQDNSARTPLAPAQALRLLVKPAESAREYFDDGPRALAIKALEEDVVAPVELAMTLDLILCDRRNPSRLKVLELACRKADSESAPIIVLAASRFGAEYLGARPVSGVTRIFESRVLDAQIVDQFVGKYANFLTPHLGDDTILLDTLYGWLFYPEIRQHGRLGFLICRAVATLSVPTNVRRQYAQRILENYDFWGHSVPSEFVELLNEPMWEVLRNRVIGSSNSTSPFPDAIARLLADRGDMQVLAALNHVERTRIQTEVLQGHDPEVVPGTLSWRIRAQNPPDNLLSWLARGPSESMIERVNQGDRIWLMRRAVELGVDRQRIRDAAIEYGTSYLDAGRPWRTELPEFKTVAITLEVLNADDLPQVAPVGSSSDDQASVTSQPVLPPPADQAAVDPWKYWRPNEDNYEDLAEWMATVDWNSIPDNEGFDLLIGKMCELDLIRPDMCPEMTTQP